MAAYGEKPMAIDNGEPPPQMEAHSAAPRVLDDIPTEGRASNNGLAVEVAPPATRESPPSTRADPLENPIKRIDQQKLTSLGALLESAATRLTAARQAGSAEWCVPRGALQMVKRDAYFTRGLCAVSASTNDRDARQSQRKARGQLRSSPPVPGAGHRGNRRSGNSSAAVSKRAFRLCTR
jgi:hypothetical protein